MSPRSLDPISRRPEKPADKPAGSQPVSPSRKADTARSIPNTADRDQMLAKAQANLRAKKDKQAKGRRKVILSVVLVVAVVFLAGAAFLGYQSYQKQKYFAVIDGKPVTRDEYDKMMKLAESNKENKAEASKKYLEAMRNKAAADKVGLEYDDASAIYLARVMYPKKTYQELDAWQKLMVDNKSLQTSIENRARGGYDVAIFYFPFSLHQETLGFAFRNSPPPGYGDPNVIADDKRYAQDKLNVYRSQVESGANQVNVLQAIWQDPRLQYAGAPNNSRLAFLTDSPEGAEENLADNVSRIYRNDIDITKLNKEASVGLSPNYTGKISILGAPGKSSQVDGYFYFYKVNAYYPPNKDIEAKYKSILDAQKVVQNG